MSFCAAQRQRWLAATALVWQSHNVPVWQSHRACGRARGRRRAVAPTLTPLVSTHPPKIAIPLLGGISQDVGLCQDDIILAEPEHPGQPGCLASNHASQARNPKGPQITPFCHQMGRHPTVLDATSAEFRQISAQRSLGGSRPFNLNFFPTYLEPKNAKITMFVPPDDGQ